MVFLHTIFLSIYRFDYITIYSIKNTYPKDKKEIIELILDTLSSAPEIATTLDSNYIMVQFEKIKSHFKHKNAKPEQIKEFFDCDIIYKGIKNINFLFETHNNNDTITLDLHPIYGMEIDSEDLEQNTELNDFNILGKLTLTNDTYNSLNPRYFKLAEDIIINYIQKYEHNDNLIIGFQDYKNTEEIMNPKDFFDKIKDYKEQYCNNPNSE